MSYEESRLAMGEAYMMCSDCCARLHSFDGNKDQWRTCPYHTKEEKEKMGCVDKNYAKPKSRRKNHTPEKSKTFDANEEHKLCMNCKYWKTISNMADHGFCSNKKYNDMVNKSEGNTSAWNKVTHFMWECKFFEREDD